MNSPSLCLILFPISFLITTAFCRAQTPSNSQPVSGQSIPSAGAHHAAAKTDPDPDTITAALTLEPTTITVTALRNEDQIQYNPQSQNIISIEMMQRRQPVTPNMLLREEPGIFANQVGNQGSPIIRGQIGNRVLYLWDNIRLNNGALFSGPNGYFNEFPIGAIDRIEVVRGPGAVQYGSDAVGGVINIIGKHRDDFGDGRRFGGTIYGHYGSVNTDQSTYGDLWGSFTRWNFSSGITGQNIGNYSAPGLGVIKNNSFATEGGYFDSAYRLREKQMVHFTWIENRRDDVVAYSQSKMNASGIPRSIVPYETRGIGKVTYDAKNLSGWSNELKLYAYFEHFRSPRDVDVESANAFNLTHTVTSQAVFGGGAQNITALRKSALVYGADYRSENIFSKKLLFTTTKATNQVAISIPSGSVPPGTYRVFDAFVIERWQPVSRITLSISGRIESIHLKSNPRPEDALTPFTIADLTQDKRWNPMTGSAGAVYNVFGSLNVAVNIASSFRAPSFSDMLSTGVPLYATGIATVPSPGVKPERAITYEIGPRWSSRHLNFHASAYWTTLTNLVVAQSSGTIKIPGIGVVTAQTNTNSATGYMQGVEIAGAYHVNSQWNLIGNFTYTRGQDTFQNVRLRFVPPANGLVGVLWNSPHKRFWSEGTVMLADRMRHHAPNDELDAGFSKDPGYGSPSATNPAYRPGFQIPGYAVANLRFGAKLLVKEKRGIDLTLDWNNVLNQPYREAYSQQEILAPGAGVVLGGRWTF